MTVDRPFHRARAYAPTRGMVCELVRIALDEPPGDWMERQRCVRRGLVHCERLTRAGKAALERAVRQFKIFEARHGR